MQKYEGKVKTNFFWIVPLLIGVSRNNIDDKANTFALHITPFLEIGFNWTGTRSGYEVK